eukprot:gnl/MRDRNA2_/MRDRNA2_53653_c0_seq2.p1 gnl/MRDRNA2_/MRDRNA2_53653_c0~~gnl/MRDRNA2_/MRDRNA2_53653_c0_seq2.p1  ORF type:complete len:356 (+),score=66.62 gnl/MRDRNA2_/MRDRNA2_53653_c0_seq2:157-1068(+)
MAGKSIAPWHIADDSCGSRPEPPAGLALCFAVVLSTSDEAGAQYRHVLRGAGRGQDSPVWLQRFSTAGGTQWAFFVEEDGPFAPGFNVEKDQFNDIILMPKKSSLGMGAFGSFAKQQAGASPSQLQFIFTSLRDFQFQWLIIAQQDVFIEPSRIWQLLASIQPPSMRALGAWENGQLNQHASPPFVVLSRDIHAILSDPRRNAYLNVGKEQSLSSASSTNSLFASLLGHASSQVGGGLTAWLQALNVQRLQLPGVHITASHSSCPISEDIHLVYPVDPARLHLLSEAALQGPPCQVLHASGMA